MKQLQFIKLVNNLKMNKCWIIWYRIQVQQVYRKKKVLLDKETHKVASVLLALSYL